MESIISNTAFLIDNSYFPFIIYQSNTVNTIIKDTERKPVYIPQEYCESPCCCNKSCCNKKHQIIVVFAIAYISAKCLPF